LLDRDEWLLLAGEANLGPGRSYLLGDANLNGDVDGSDFGAWNANKFTSIAAWSAGDFNANGDVDGSDFGIWNANKFQSALAAIVVPEPATGPIALVIAWWIALSRLDRVRSRIRHTCFVALTLNGQWQWDGGARAFGG
jgi:hypothetical protein